MTPYIILVVVIFLFRGITYRLPENKGNTWFLILTFIYLYIFCSIRSFDVGIDIPGYIEEYNITAAVNWEDWDYVYFENGYIALMKICNYIGLSARGFFYVVYFLILFPIFLLLKKYSVAPLTSVLIFLCYQFFTFDLSGLRQAIAISICILAFIISTSNNRKNILISIGLVFLATYFHRSSILFLPVYFIMRLPINVTTICCYTIASVFCIALNALGVATVLSLYDNDKYTMTDELRLGLSIAIIIFFIISALFAQYNLENEKYERINRYSTNLIFTALCLLFLFNGSNLLRANMYYLFPILISTAYTKKALKWPLNFIYIAVLYGVLLTHFFTNELSTFNVTPYEIGESQEITQ